MKKITMLFILLITLIYNPVFAWEVNCDPKEETTIVNNNNKNFNINKNELIANQTQSQTQVLNVTEGPSYSFSGIGGSVNPQQAASTALQQASSATAAKSPAATPSDVKGIGVGGIGQANNSGSGQINNGIGNQLNNDGTYNNYSGNGAGSLNINNKYEEARQMAAVVAGAVTSELHFKDGAHSTTTDSRVISVNEIIDLLDTLSYEDCKSGKGGEGDVIIIPALVRPQFYKTKEIKFHKDLKQFDKKDYRFIGFVTGVAGINNLGMENVVYALGEFGMDNGATDLVRIKESSTEWGDSSGYGFDLGAFVTSVIGGYGRNSYGPAGSATGGINGMKGGSADRSDVKFAAFVSNTHLIEVSKKFQKQD
jgi:hypothetical protein